MEASVQTEQSGLAELERRKAERVKAGRSRGRVWSRRNPVEQAVEEVWDWALDAVAGPRGSLRALAQDARPLPKLSPLHQRALVETQLLTAAALLAFALAAALGRALAPFAHLLARPALLGLGGLLLLPALALAQARAATSRPSVLRRRTVWTGLVMGLASGSWLSGRVLRARLPPLFLGPLLAGLLWALLPAAALRHRVVALVSGVAVPALAIAALHGHLAPAGAGQGLWYLAALLHTALAFLNAQAQLRALRDARFRPAVASLVATAADALLAHLLTLALAAPPVKPCYVPPFDEHALISATKVALCDAFAKPQSHP